MDGQDFRIHVIKDVFIIVFEKEVFLKNFFFISETIRERLKSVQKCLIDTRRITYCNSQCIAFLFSMIKFLNTENIPYDILYSDYIKRLFDKLQMNKIIQK